MDRGLKMASSPSHKLGQFIGDLLEKSIISFLKTHINEDGLFFDYKHPRLARQNKKEVLWEDINGNKHKLDIVIEQGGTELIFGNPRVFIEIAWRRYKKHSKNKVQEISSAIKPLISKYINVNPFYGVVLAGEFTIPSIEQIKSLGFAVVHISMSDIEKIFYNFGINLHWEENTSEEELANKVQAVEQLSQKQLDEIQNNIIKIQQNQFDMFLNSILQSIHRTIESVIVTILHGKVYNFPSAQHACEFLAKNVEFKDSEFEHYEIFVKYSNGDRSELTFTEKRQAIAWLQFC